eukprot:14762229-Heterocapsa_arctica.AAC.1
MCQLGSHTLDLVGDVGGDAGGRIKFAHCTVAGLVSLGLAQLGPLERAHASRELHMQGSRL